MTDDALFEWRRDDHGEALVCAPLAAIAPHVFTTRALGPARTDEELASAYAEVARRLALTPANLRDARQVHGATVLHATRAAWAGRPEADALITSEADVGVLVRVADCVPVLLADQRTGAVAAVHAGWRGTAAGIVMTAVKTMSQVFATAPSDIVAAIGPAIGACCYQVGADVFDTFVGRADRLPEPGRWFQPDGDRWRLDVAAANRDQLVAAGVGVGRIHACGICTASTLDRFYSFRAERDAAGRQIAAIRPAGR